MHPLCDVVRFVSPKSLAAPLAALAAAAHAGVAPLEYTSSARGFTGNSIVLANGKDQDTDSFEWTFLRQFVDAFQTTASTADGESTFSSIQVSDVAPFGVSGTGNASADVTLDVGGTSLSQGTTYCTVTFTLAEATPYRLIGFLFGESGSTAEIVITGPGGDLVALEASDDSMVVREEGVLDPGAYEVHFAALGSASLAIPGANQSSATFTMYFSVSEHPADLNNDGAVNGPDLGLMLGQWGACAGCYGDIDGDGFVDGADLGVLLGDWS